MFTKLWNWLITPKEPLATQLTQIIEQEAVADVEAVVEPVKPATKKPRKKKQ